MKELKEWVDANGNKSSGSKQTNDLFKDRFMKLAKHIEDYHDWSTVYYVSEWELELEFRSGYDVFNLVIDVNTTAIDLVVTNTKTHQEIVTATVGHNEWSKILTSLQNIGVIKDKKLCEWVDSKGNKASSNNTTKQVTTNTVNEVVYIWDMYIDPRDKGTWCSAEEYNGEYDGSVFKTKEAAFNEGKIHLYEIEDEGELRGDPEDYDIDVVAIPKNKVSDYTLEFSGLL
jgi:hypothetical protein